MLKWIHNAFFTRFIHEQAGGYLITASKYKHSDIKNKNIPSDRLLPLYHSCPVYSCLKVFTSSLLKLNSLLSSQTCTHFVQNKPNFPSTINTCFVAWTALGKQGEWAHKPKAYIQSYIPLCQGSLEKTDSYLKWEFLFKKMQNMLMEPKKCLLGHRHKTVLCFSEH